VYSIFLVARFWNVAVGAQLLAATGKLTLPGAGEAQSRTVEEGERQCRAQWVAYFPLFTGENVGYHCSSVAGRQATWHSLWLCRLSFAASTELLVLLCRPSLGKGLRLLRGATRSWRPLEGGIPLLQPLPPPLPTQPVSIRTFEPIVRGSNGAPSEPQQQQQPQFLQMCHCRVGKSNVEQA